MKVAFSILSFLMCSSLYTENAEILALTRITPLQSNDNLPKQVIHTTKKLVKAEHFWCQRHDGESKGLQVKRLTYKKKACEV